MSAALMAQPGLHSMAMAVSMKAKVRGKNRKRKKSTMAGGACATRGIGIGRFVLLGLGWSLFAGL